MKIFLLASVLLCCTESLMAQKSTTDCSSKKCDCVHLPCPAECKSCCGISQGRIQYFNGKSFKLDNGETFAIDFGSKQHAHGDEVVLFPTTGTKVTVYYRQSGKQRIAERVVSHDAQVSIPPDK